MNAFKFRIGNKDSLDIRETFETPQGRRYVNEYPHLDLPRL